MLRSIKARVSLTLVLVSVLMLTVSGFGLFLTLTVADEYQATIDERLPQIQLLTNLTTDTAHTLKDTAILLYAHHLEPSEDDAENTLRQSLHTMVRHAVEYQQIAIEENGGENRVEIAHSEDLVEMIKQYQVEVDQAIRFNLASETDTDRDAIHIGIQRSADRLVLLVAEAFKIELDEIAEAQGTAHEVQSVAILVSVIAAVVALGLALGVWSWLSHSLNTPLNVLKTASQRLGEGDLDLRVPKQNLVEFDLLAKSFNRMARDIRRGQKEREKIHRKMTDASRMAGMAEIATGVLHNVGNALNSVNIAAERLGNHVAGMKTRELSSLSQLVDEQGEDLAGFITEDERGRHLPAFLHEISAHFDGQARDANDDIKLLLEKVTHIKNIVSFQQKFAKVSGASENIRVRALVDEALHMVIDAYGQCEIELERDVRFDRVINTDRHQVIQVLVNLLNNARHAMDGVADRPKKIALLVTEEGDHVSFTVTDSGIGIAPENLTKVFEHGFTTRKEGHGFGLHTAALLSTQLGGDLTAYSDGVGCGATFVFRIAKNTPEKQDTPVTTKPARITA